MIEAASAAAAEANGSPVFITSLVVAVAALITALTPIYVRRRRQAAGQSRDAVVSWEAITRTLQEERDRHQRRADEAERTCNERVAVATARAEAAEAEVARLRQAIAEFRR